MLLTFFISLLLFGLVIVASLTYLRPTYRVNASQLIVLFDQVLAGRASTQDWLVFTAMPIRYDPDLEAIRLQCLVLEQAHFLGDASRFLFDSTGLEAIAHIRQGLMERQGGGHL
ncbi:hypothetical protein QWY82_07105 [Simiduia curdlanivorans]|uniref:Uncharacterized protein n=1 Tax=Simiduia curdlanivorans TaxID=1492769 RepID=A0ABV8V7V1_9GAMM|nr:hypothetical protein [Simiduia curdlanivorans]MDN3638569.1 hypothetical protein [Simiduia curdlanivorans]